MKPVRAMLAPFLIIILLSTTASPVYAADVPTVEDGKGLVVLYRLSKAKGAAVGFNLNSSSGFSGSLKNGSYLVEQLTPGEYKYTVSSPSLDGQDSISLSIVAGQTYFIKGEIKWGWPAGRAKFTLVSESTGLSELAKIK